MLASQGSKPVTTVVTGTASEDELVDFAELPHHVLTAGQASESAPSADLAITASRRARAPSSQRWQTAASCSPRSQSAIDSSSVDTAGLESLHDADELVARLLVGQVGGRVAGRGLVVRHRRSFAGRDGSRRRWRRRVRRRDACRAGCQGRARRSRSRTCPSVVWTTAYPRWRVASGDSVRTRASRWSRSSAARSRRCPTYDGCARPARSPVRPAGRTCGAARQPRVATGRVRGLAARARSGRAARSAHGLERRRPSATPRRRRARPASPHRSGWTRADRRPGRAAAVSSSCPMALTTGVVHAATARTSPSSENGSRSSSAPPPRRSR